MKIAGIDPKTLPSIETLVLPRGEQQVIFQARGLSDLEEFDKLCPEPICPIKQTRNGPEPDSKESGYVAAMKEYVKRRTAYVIVKSLEPTNIEWDTVKMDVPSTWANWQDDLKANHFTQSECNLIFNLCWGANQLDEEKLRKAREAFLRGPQTA